MQSWSDADYFANARQYTIFARVVPEQKVKLVEAFKKDGFTAMVGDGANDALAIKRADLGIAMFDGAPATRQLAGVVLMNNSFTALPGAVKLADNFIGNIEIFAGVFLNQSLLGFFLFLFVSMFGHAFPLTPLNITLINYFAVGLPSMLISYWAVMPAGKVLRPSSGNFLRRIVPFAMLSGFIGAIGVMVVFMRSPQYLQAAESNTLVIIAIALFGSVFLLLAPTFYRGILPSRDFRQVIGLVLIEFLLAIVVARIHLLTDFFDITYPFPSIGEVKSTILVVCAFGLLQYLFMRYIISLKRP